MGLTAGRESAFTWKPEQSHLGRKRWRMQEAGVSENLLDSEWAENVDAQDAGREGRAQDVSWIREAT